MRAFAEAPTSSMTASAGSLKASPLAPIQRQQHRAPRRQQQRMQTVSMAGHGRFFVGGNWKCNGDMASTKELVAGLNAGSFPKEVEVVVAAPFVYVPYVADNLDKSKYAVAAQNCWVNKGGAFTGEVTPAMIKDVGAPWVVIGHSERRALCGETNEVVGAKVKNALEEGLKIVACIGETLEERESGVMWDVLDGQMRAIAANVSNWDAVVIAYEPVWAIGTGVVATPAQAQEVHAYLRNWLDTKVEHNVAEKTRILYGGSVNDANCAELATQSDIDGFLVGGASLKASSFLTICNAPRAVAA